MKPGEAAAEDAIDELEQGRASYQRRAWLDAYMSLSAADRVESLRADDLELLGTSAYMIGREEDSSRPWSARTTPT